MGLGPGIMRKIVDDAAKLVHNACCRLCQHDVVYCRVIDRFLHEVIRTFSYYSSDIIVSEWLYHSKGLNPAML